MDIHPPERPIRSVRDFLLQIFTITCGIVIALGMEEAVQAHRDAVLRDQSRAQFAAEIAANTARIDTAEQQNAKDEAWLMTALKGFDERLRHQPHGAPESPTAPRSFPQMQAAAWQTALATRAIAQFDFAQVQALATAYERQTAFNDFAVRAREQYVGIAAYGDIDSLTDEELRAGSGQLIEALGYLVSMAHIEADLKSVYANAQTQLGRK